MVQASHALALVLLETGREAEAVALMRKAVKDSPGYLPVKESLARLGK